MAKAKAKAKPRALPEPEVVQAVVDEAEAAADAVEASANDDAIAEVLTALQGVVGEDHAQLLGSDGLSIKIKGIISTQVATIDAAIGRGGVPRSRLTIIHGAEGSGKTTLALQIAAECQRVNGVVVYIDKEYKLDPEYAAALKVNVGKIIYLQPDHLEGAFAAMEVAIKRLAPLRKAGLVGPMVIILDSMNAAITKAQFEGEWEDKHMAPQARVFSELTPKLMPLVHKEDVSLIWISQVRKKVGVVFGDDNEVAGGNAPKFYASLILFVTRLAKEKDGGEAVGNKIRVDVKKNQIAPPFKKAECTIVYGRGIDGEIALLQQGEKLKLVKKSGSWLSVGKERVGQGYKSAAEHLRENNKLRNKLLRAIKTKLGWE